MMAQRIDEAVFELDLYRDDLSPEEYDRRRRLIERASEPRVARLERERLLDEAVADLERSS